MQKHEMKLNPAPFKKIYMGEKTIELRLFDEKRSAVEVGDCITFTRTDNPCFWVRVEVTALHRFKDFKELYAALPMEKCGYAEGENPSSDDMLGYYSEEMQEKYGVVGIEFKVQSKPYRDLFRMEPFFKEFEQFWQRVPDWRFGQLILNFHGWLVANKHGDGFYIEDDEYVKLLKQFMDETFKR